MLKSPKLQTNKRLKYLAVFEFRDLSKMSRCQLSCTLPTSLLRRHLSVLMCYSAT